MEEVLNNGDIEKFIETAIPKGDVTLRKTLEKKLGFLMQNFSAKGQKLFEIQPNDEMRSK